MRRLKNQWGDRNVQMSKPEPIMNKAEWVLFWAVVVVGSIVTVGISWL